MIADRLFKESTGCSPVSHHLEPKRGIIIGYGSALSSLDKKVNAPVDAGVAAIVAALNLSDGVVIAVDSATTMVDASGATTKVFLDADKLFQLGNLKVGIATYGLAALDGRTIGSFVREFAVKTSNSDLGLLGLREIVERLRGFFFESYRSFAEKLHAKPFERSPTT